jgi:WD40 repeat protein
LRYYSSSISRFSLRDILNAEDKSTVDYDHQSRNKFYANYENSFEIMPDQKTIFGVDYDNRKKLKKEDISDDESPIMVISKHKGPINTITFERLNKNLIVGNDEDTVIQYKKNENGKWKIAKKFNNLGIGCVNSSLTIQNLLILGGVNFKIRIVDLEKGELLGKVFETAMEHINSMQIVNQEEKVLLKIIGVHPDYSNDKSDVYDFTQFLKKYGKGKAIEIKKESEGSGLVCEE